MQQCNLSPASQRALVRWLIDRLTTEYPDIFSIDVNRILCRHTNETITLDENLELREDSTPGIQYRPAFDALANQVAEDICLIQRDGSRDWLAAAHVSAAPVIGQRNRRLARPSPPSTQPVPGIEAINQRTALQSMTPESRRYKGVEASVDLILAWLAAS